MRAGMLVAMVAASTLLAGSTAFGACQPSKHRKCIDFGSVPQISERIVAAEPIAAAPKKNPIGDAEKAYTGPTIGTVPNTRRAPEVGYRWAIN